MILERLQIFLENHDVKYLHIKHSPAYSDREIIRTTPGLARIVMVETVFGADNTKLEMVMVPPDQMIDFNLMRARPKAKQVQLATEDQLREMFVYYEVDEKVPPLHLISSYLADNLTRQADIVLYEHSYTNLIKLTYEDFAELFQAQVADFLVPKRYKMKLKYIAPSSAKYTWNSNDKCILGFSMENPNFDTPKLKGIVEWINRHFKQCIIMIGDSIHRNTLQINHHLSEEEALKRSEQMAAEVMAETQGIFKSESNVCQFEWVLCSSVQKREDYRRYYDQLSDLVGCDEQFTQSVYEFAKLFTVRRRKHATDYVKLANAYLLEESAIISCLVSDGYPCFVYPGTLGIFEEFANGKHSAIPEPLKEIIFLGLHR